MTINGPPLHPEDLKSALERFWSLSAEKIRRMEKRYDFARGAPVITERGQYQPRKWTEWTLGFYYGSAAMQFEMSGGEEFWGIAREGAAARLSPYLTHFGVHDHGFNILSAYGPLLRLMIEGKTPHDSWERRCYELALKVSGAVQARRWTPLPGGGGYIYSFNGPHSLFVDTLRSCRSLIVSHLLGHVLLEDDEKRVSLLERALAHARTTARHAVFHGEGRDAWDARGRVAHETIFNPATGAFRCHGTQQGYSPFSTWTRGLAWAILGFAELLELTSALPEEETPHPGGRAETGSFLLEAARATADFYIENTPADGIPYWDTGAPGLARLGDYLIRPADPRNDHEPVDSSAAAIAVQGLLRLGHYLGEEGLNYWQAGLAVLKTLLDEPYLCLEPDREGLILHSVYHRPKGWDRVPEGSGIPRGESSMWGDYHAREVALYLGRILNGEPYYTFFACAPSARGKS